MIRRVRVGARVIGAAMVVLSLVLVSGTPARAQSWVTVLSKFIENSDKIGKALESLADAWARLTVGAPLKDSPKARVDKRQLYELGGQLGAVVAKKQRLALTIGEYANRPESAAWQGISERFADIRRDLERALDSLQGSAGPFAMTDTYTRLIGIVSGKIDAIAPWQLKSMPPPTSADELRLVASLETNVGIEAGALAKVRRAMARYVDLKYREVPD